MTGAAELHFDGTSSYIEIPDSADFSVPTTGALTVAAWIRPDTLSFPSAEGSGYVHWLGKGETGRQEWVFRMYNQENTENPPRPNRISFYVFNPVGGEGVGSYFQEPLAAGQWIHVVGAADDQHTYIYRDGSFKRCDQYQGAGDGTCHGHPLTIQPQHGAAPLRIGTRDFRSFFQGVIRDVRIWNRLLTADEIAALAAGGPAPADGQVTAFALDQDIAVDATGLHNGVIAGAAWQPAA